MLSLALRSGLPLISVTTEDEVNIAEILSFESDNESFMLLEEEQVAKLSSPVFASTHQYFYTIKPEGLIYANVYEELVKTNRTLVVVNPESTDPLMFNTGTVHLPKQLLNEFLGNFIEQENIEGISSVLGGLTLKDVGEICRISMTEYGELSPRAVLSIRRLYTGRIRGVSQVDTSYPYYYPSQDLIAWISTDGQVFKMEGIPSELIPRGLLFSGPAGVGKTLGSKYIANQLQLPLYRLDLASMMDKYQGVSQQVLDSALTMIDSCEPCIVLVDEIEKVIHTNSDSTGTNPQMLAMLLWWLQEHKSKVLTIFTTNDTTSLPNELYRPGRIDSEIKFEGISDKSRMYDFCKGVYTSLGMDYSFDPLWETMSHGGNKLSQAELTKRVYSMVKKYLVHSE